MSKKFVIVGGVAGGATTAARLRRLNEDAEIILIERGADISFANCGLPYYIGGVIENRENLLAMTPSRFKNIFNIDVRTLSEVTKVDAENKKIFVKNSDATYKENFDVLVLSPGAKPLRSPIPGIDSKNIFTLRNVPDADEIKKIAEKFSDGKAVVIGGGFVGIETAENLRERGLEVTLVEAVPHILAPFDDDIVEILEKEISAHGINLILNDGVKNFSEIDDKNLKITLSSGKEISANFVILSIGVRPDTEFLKNSGIELGERGHILVDEFLQEFCTAKNIFAVGDAVMTFDSLTGNKTALALAGPANRQGRLVADNISGKNKKYRGVIGSSILKIFDLTAAATGKNEKILQREGKIFGEDYKFAITYPTSHATYYPGAENFILKTIFSAKDGKILGAQAVGKNSVDKTIDLVASVLHFGGTIQDLQELELTYAPPFSSAKAPINMAGYVLENIFENLSKPILPRDLKNKIESGAQIIDLRSPKLFEKNHIEGAINIPAEKLRANLDKLDKNREIILTCKTGLNGYFMEQMLRGKGFKVKTLAGGNAYKNFVF